MKGLTLVYQDYQTLLTHLFIQLGETIFLRIYINRNKERNNWKKY